MSRRRRRFRPAAVAIDLAELHHIPAIMALCRKFGEKHVDIRQSKALEWAIIERRFFIFIDLESGAIIGCAGVYPYRAGPQLLNELGTNVLKPQWRGRGLADFIVALRAIDALVNDPGSICVAELYLDSVKSLAVLERNGFVEVEPCEGRTAHAAAASDKPVRHMQLRLGAIPYLASLIAEIADSGVLKYKDCETHVVFPASYWISTPAGSELLAELIEGNFRSIRAGEEERDAPSTGDLPAPTPPPRPPKRSN